MLRDNFKKFSVAALIVFGVLSCSVHSPKKDSQTVNPMVEQALETIRIIESDVSQGQLLLDVPEKEKSTFLNILYQIKIALLRLKQDPENAIHKNFLREKKSELTNTALYAYDQYNISQLLEILDGIVNNLLYAATFNEDLNGFNQYAVKGKANWVVEAGRSRTYLKITGFKLGSNEVWLLSPRIDLTNASESSLELTQAVGFLDSWDDLTLLISHDYQNGSPLDAHWETLNIQNRPPFEPRWVFTTSEDVSLAEFQNQPFVIGFRFKNDTSAPTWEIDQLKIKGFGTANVTPWTLIGKTETADDKSNPINTDIKPGSSPDKPADKKNTDDTKPVKPGTNSDSPATTEPKTPDTTASAGIKVLWQEGFTEGLGSFKPFDEAGDAKWLQKSYVDRNNNNTKEFYANISGYRSGTNKDWLLSPLLDLTKAVAPKLKIRQKYGHFDASMTSFKIMIAKDFSADSPLNAQWQILSIKNLPATPSGSTSPFTPWQDSEDLDLSGYTGDGGKIVVAFVYESTDAMAPTWQIDEVSISGEGSLITSEITLATPVAP